MYLENGGRGGGSAGVLIFVFPADIAGGTKGASDEQGMKLNALSLWLQGSEVIMVCGHVSVKCGHTLWSGARDSLMGQPTGL